MSDITQVDFTATNTITDTPKNSITDKRVLIIEDIAEMRLMLKSLMTSLGYEKIDVEPSGQGGLKRILNFKYDIVLSDYNLGGNIDGQHILETTRKNYSLDHSAIFMMITADTTYESVVSAVEYEPDSYLVKPFPPTSFHRRFNKIIGQKKIFSIVDQARKKDDYESMEKHAQEILKAYPQYASMCLKVIGESLYKRKQYKSAKQHYAMIVDGNSTLAWAYYGMAQCDVQLEEFPSAINHLEKTVALSKHFLSAYDLLADVHTQMGNLEKAQSAILRALENSPRSVERSQRLGRVSIEIKDWVIAEQSFSRAIRLAKDTSSENVELYYDYLKTITAMLEQGIEGTRLQDKFRRALSRLRSLGQSNPNVLSNSFRLEIQQLLYRNHLGEAIRSWQLWSKLIEKGEASALTLAQELTLKKRLGLL
ncbi:Chemotaxis protein CheY [Marinomonas spartinae]|uniref:Chemotaxis protein CheY n=1 Tax=Marinomonas spartinae TaxID=1792290 RepID=A0A1A8TQE3_9GAMM|nr:response regulator [Marinomonas spartinae]SBS35652.1 Chemotaxis protein CheY [Marinomonas spartinae]